MCFDSNDLRIVIELVCFVPTLSKRSCNNDLKYISESFKEKPDIMQLPLEYLVHSERPPKRLISIYSTIHSHGRGENTDLIIT